MRLHELKAVPGATRAPKRKGRGTATGQGKTAGRGMNGQNSRSFSRVDAAANVTPFTSSTT